MNILLVDDDEYILDHLFQHLKKSDFGFSNIYIATSLQGAQKVLELLPIDILVSDIEMPGGNGLDLIEWTRNRERIIPCLLLTSYADFNYAHRAMQLKTMEYLLKPVDLSALDKSLRAAIATIQKDRADHQNRLYRNYWLDLQSDAKDMFWRKVLKQEGTFPHADYTAIGYEPEDYFLTVSLEISSLSAIEEKWGFSMFEYALKNVILELLTSPFFIVESILRISGQWVILCQFTRQRANDTSPIEDCIKSLIENCKIHMQIHMRAVVGRVCTATKIPENVQEIRKILKKTTNNTSLILNCEDFYQSKEKSSVPTPTLNLWEELLREGNHQALLGGIAKYLNKQQERQLLSRSDLVTFRQDITHMVYTFLKRSNIQAHKLFANPGTEVFYSNACNSIQDMETYCTLLLDKALAHTKIISKPDFIVDEVLSYIDEHFCEDISRHTITNFVYLSPDYVSRLFKKRTGLNFAQYIIEKRMVLARNMIKNSDMSIKAVSMHVGYTNFSYFAKLFRESTGYAPIEYRDKCHEAKQMPLTNDS